LAAIAALVVVVLSIWAWRHRHHNQVPQNLPPAVYKPANSDDVLPLPKR
jgi:heme A synthase